MGDDRCDALQGSSARIGSDRRQRRNVWHKRGLNTKIHLAVDSFGLPLRAIVTEGSRADCKEALNLIAGIPAESLLADKGYDSNEIIDAVLSLGIKPVIPPRDNRIQKRDYDSYLYKFRHLVENAFLRLKRRWRGIATRYAKRASSFLAYVHIASSMEWISVLS